MGYLDYIYPCRKKREDLTSSDDGKGRKLERINIALKVSIIVSYTDGTHSTKSNRFRERETEREREEERERESVLLHYICWVEFPFQVLLSSSLSSWVRSLWILPSFLKSSGLFSIVRLRRDSLRQTKR